VKREESLFICDELGMIKNRTIEKNKYFYVFNIQNMPIGSTFMHADHSTWLFQLGVSH
tara:strand:- start:1261 stop:1434 length:174 start_codon:yes stop_codon:yes gene_type:complete